LQDGRFTVSRLAHSASQTRHRLSNWTFRFCSVANALALPHHRAAILHVGGVSSDPAFFGSESHTPTRQPNHQCAFAGNKNFPAKRGTSAYIAGNRLVAQLIMAAGAFSLDFSLIPLSFQRICPATGGANFRSSRRHGHIVRPIINEEHTLRVFGLRCFLFYVFLQLGITQMRTAFISHSIVTIQHSTVRVVIGYALDELHVNRTINVAKVKVNESRRVYLQQPRTLCRQLQFCSQRFLP